MPSWAARAREYRWLLVGALLGGVAGALFDQITFTLSPEYFREGKAIATIGVGVRPAVALVGFRGGLAPGALVAGVDLVARRRRAGLRRAWWTLDVAIVTGAAIAACSVLLVVVKPLGSALDALGWDSAMTNRFFVVWGGHVGAHVGIAAGLATGWWRHVRARRPTGRCN